MSFEQIDRQAFDIETGQIIELPFEVETVLSNKQSKFYIINAEIPLGLEFAPGQLLICESHRGGVAIKAWRFTNEEWKKTRLGGGIHVDEFAKLIRISSGSRDYNYEHIWFPGEEAWRRPGFVVHCNQHGEFDRTGDYAFQDFMDKYFPYPAV